MSEVKERGPVIEITEEELKRLCGEFFDVAYYSALYQGNTTDKSIDIYKIAEKNILARFYFKKTQEAIELKSGNAGIIPPILTDNKLFNS